MTEERKSFWHRIFFGNETESEQERKVREYLIHRVGDGAHLRDVLGEEYVRRNATPDEVQRLLEDPRLIEAAHEQMRNDFASGDLDPRRPPSSATS